MELGFHERLEIHAEHAAERLRRRIGARTRAWAVHGPQYTKGESLALEVMFKRGDDWSLRRVIGIYPGGEVRQRVNGVRGNNGAVSDPDPQGADALYERNHASNLTLAADLRRMGMLDPARDCVERARHWRRRREGRRQEAEALAPYHYAEAAE